MATIEDLTIRIEAATVILESDVTDITAFKGSLEGAVTAAETARDDAQSYATQAQAEVENILALHPILKGEYGETVNFTTNPTLATATDFENSYGRVYKLKIGATQVNLNGLPATLDDGWHMYVFNATGSTITIAGTQTVAGDFVVPTGHYVRINRDIDAAYHVYDLTSAAPAGGVFRETTLINGFSTALSQQPVGLDTPLQIEFGAAQGTIGDPVMLSATGAITFNQAGQYIINYQSHFGRIGATGVSELYTRSLVNGVVVGNSRHARISSSDQVLPFALRVKVNVNAGDVLTLQLIRDSSGNNSGGFFQGDPIAAGFPNAPSATMEVSRLEGSVDENAGVNTFIDLLDTPPSYTGQAGKALVVKGDETGVEFVPVSGAVDSVNGQTGVVVLDAADVGARPDTYVPDYADITGKPSTFPPSAHVHSAADITSGVLATARLGTGTANSTKVLKGDGTWGDAPAPTPVGFPIAEVNLTYNSVPMTNWPQLNPHENIDLALVSNPVASVSGVNFFLNAGNLALLPCGKYFSAVAMGNLPAGGMITVERQAATGNTKRAYAFVQGLGGDTRGHMWVHRTSDNTWNQVHQAT